MDWRIAALVSMLALGVYNVLLNKFVKEEDWRVLIPIVFVASIILMAYFALSYKELSNKMNESSIILALSLIILISIANAFIFLAYVNGGPVSLVIPIINLATLISVGIAIVYFHEEVTIQIAAGIALGLISVFLLTYK
jgi:drug/metabolite transporter (DMT)-like permease